MSSRTRGSGAGGRARARERPGQREIERTARASSASRAARSRRARRACEAGLDLLLERVDLLADALRASAGTAPICARSCGELALLAEDLGVLVAERLLGRGRRESARGSSAPSFSSPSSIRPRAFSLTFAFGDGAKLALRLVRLPAGRRRASRWPPKRPGSTTARSARILRSMPMLGLLQPADEARVGRAVDAGGGVDARDPQATEVALLALAADVRVLPGVVNDLDGYGEEAHRPPQKPSAWLRMRLRRRRALNPRLTLGMVSYLQP